MFHAPSPTALLIIGVLLVIFFGKDNLPATARSFGKSIRAFKEEMSSVTESVQLEQSEVTAGESVSTEAYKKTVSKAK